METICTFFLNYQQYIILFTMCFFAGMAWRHHRLISRLFIIAASCLWVIYVYRYQIAVGWPALDASGELSLRELFSDGAFTRHWSSLLSAAALGGALGAAFNPDTYKPDDPGFYSALEHWADRPTLPPPERPELAKAATPKEVRMTDEQFQ